MLYAPVYKVRPHCKAAPTLYLGVPVGATVEVLFLGLYVWWTRGGGPPQRTRVARSVAGRSGALLRAQWTRYLSAFVVPLPPPSRDGAGAPVSRE